MQKHVRKSSRSRLELSNEYLLANIGVDAAENEPSDVRPARLPRTTTPKNAPLVHSLQVLALVPAIPLFAVAHAVGAALWPAYVSTASKKKNKRKKYRVCAKLRTCTSKVRRTVLGCIEAEFVIQAPLERACRHLSASACVLKIGK